MLPQPAQPPVEAAKPESVEVKQAAARKVVATRLAKHIHKVNKGLSVKEANAYADYINEACKEFQLDNQLLVALITVESRFRIEAVSQAGAKGLTQVIPSYHQDKITQAKQKLNLYSIYEPRLNIYVGAWVLRDYMDNSKDMHSALQRYNGSLDDPSQSYANKVFAVYHTLQDTGPRN